MEKGQNKGHEQESRMLQTRENNARQEDFVLEKNIFSNIFEKDIRRVFIYKKAERLAKAIHLITPAFAESASLRSRMDAIAIGLIDAAILPPAAARAVLSRELLALSSVLSIAHAGGLLSSMNAELISREAQHLLQEVAAYEEPRIFLDDAPSLADIARRVGKRPPLIEARGNRSSTEAVAKPRPTALPKTAPHAQVPVSDILKDRRSAILSVITNKGGKAGIKDISTVILGVSEKTIQRELQALVEAGTIRKQGERRWSMYSII